MRKADVMMLFDYSYWATRQILGSAAEVSNAQFAAPSDVTWRGIRGTLVHTLDVERSWRARLRGEPKESWDAVLPEEEFPDMQALAERWERDEAEMLSWLGGLDDAALEVTVDLGGNDRFPLSYFLLHVITHSAQQRRDATILLTNAGHPPPEIEFLNYGDWLRERGDMRCAVPSPTSPVAAPNAAASVRFISLACRHPTPGAPP
jgi:uncharacterized damage-inducible protein DinB